MTNKWNFQKPTEEENRISKELADKLAISPVICQLLVKRGITTEEEANKFFKPSLNDLHDPFLMPDMDKAVKRLNKALGEREKILVYGDYDVDGVTAATLLAQNGVETLVLDRWTDVYPQPRAVHLDDEVYRIVHRLGIADEQHACHVFTLYGQQNGPPGNAIEF